MAWGRKGDGNQSPRSKGPVLGDPTQYSRGELEVQAAALQRALDHAPRGSSVAARPETRIALVNGRIQAMDRGLIPSPAPPPGMPAPASNVGGGQSFGGQGRPPGMSDSMAQALAKAGINPHDYEG